MKYVVNDFHYATAMTHGGKFHADDVISTVILKKIYGDSFKLIRTFRVPNDLPSNVIVYDIGGGALDHHQKGGNGVRKNGVPYSSAGLVWREFGHAIVPDEYVWEIVDKVLIQGIDAIDNGVMPWTDYPVQALSLSGIISSFNPTWDSQELSTDLAFSKAVDFATVVFDNILHQAMSKAKARSIVEDAIAKSENHIMVLERFAPWQDQIFASRNPKAINVWFVVFPSNRGGYNWQCVPDEPNSFGQRQPVPEGWHGLNGMDLRMVTGVADATFCHKNGFIGGAESLDGTMEMAKKAVKAALAKQQEAIK